MITCWLPKRNKILSIAILLVLFSGAVGSNIWMNVQAAGSAESVHCCDEQRLVGRWVRPDGGYILELSATGKNGSLKAVYFNPRPVYVSRTEMTCKDGICSIFVELRDTNYPGSTYDMRYNRTTDRLTGKYFQALQKVTYDIEFVRSK